MKIGYSTLAQHDWDYLRIKMEKALFSLHQKYNYYRNVVIDEFTIDYLIYEEGKPKLAIVILGQEFILCDDFPVFDEKEYEKNTTLLKMKSDYCCCMGLPLLKLPILELNDWPFLADEFRKALKDFEYAKDHNNWAEEEYSDISNIWMCSYENHHKVTASKKCGCFSCGSVIDSREAILCGQDSSMACPICCETTLISDFQGFEIKPESMTIIKEKYKEPED